MWAGWGGIRLRDDSLDFVFPTPPPGSTQLSLKQMAYRTWTLDVGIETQAVTVNASPSTGAAGELVVSCDGKVMRCVYFGTVRGGCMEG